MKKSVKNNLKRLAVGMVAGAMCFGSLSAWAFTSTVINGETYAVTSDKEIRVYLDRSEVAFDEVKPMIINDRTMVPVRFLGKALGIKDNNISYDEATETVTLSYNNKDITLVVGEKTAKVNIDPVELDVPVLEIDGRVLVPFRFICETFGYSVDYGETDSKMSIFMKKTLGVTKN